MLKRKGLHGGGEILSKKSRPAPSSPLFSLLFLPDLCDELIKFISGSTLRALMSIGLCQCAIKSYVKLYGFPITGTFTLDTSLRGSINGNYLERQPPICILPTAVHCKLGSTVAGPLRPAIVLPTAVIIKRGDSWAPLTYESVIDGGISLGLGWLLLIKASNHELLLTDIDTGTRVVVKTAREHRIIGCARLQELSPQGNVQFLLLRCNPVGNVSIIVCEFIEGVRDFESTSMPAYDELTGATKIASGADATYAIVPDPNLQPAARQRILFWGHPGGFAPPTRFNFVSAADMLTSGVARGAQLVSIALSPGGNLFVLARSGANTTIVVLAPDGTPLDSVDSTGFDGTAVDICFIEGVLHLVSSTGLYTMENITDRS